MKAKLFGWVGVFIQTLWRTPFSALLLGLCFGFTSANAQPYELVFSTTTSQETMVPLDGAGLLGTVQITVDPKVDNGTLEMWLNDPATADPLNRLERMPPGYMASPKRKGPIALDTNALPVGHHTVTARVTSKNDVVDVVSASFTNQGNTGQLEFERISHELPFPTAMVWGADGKLYVTEMLGIVHALTVGRDARVIEDQVLPVPELEGRLSLGIAEDPASIPNRVVLWISHSGGVSDPIADGAINSGTVSRLTLGLGGVVFEDVIVGLPRAIANHAINGIHFDTAGRLLIAMGGNTGAGAPNLGESEFGSRPEQPLSGAVLIADVNAPDFSGMCGTPGCTGPECSSWVNDASGRADSHVPESCDVEVFASGTRNLYDFLVHSNGYIYGADNGLGVSGTFPVSPISDCTGFANDLLVEEGGHNPGVQGDPLLLLEQGAYYGHPNPQRDECVYKDGSYQGLGPAPNWRAPLLELGAKTSSNGIAEYPRDVGCVKMAGDILITTYSRPDNITRTILAENGRSVVAHGPLVGDLGDPLPLSVRYDGVIFVGEFTNDEIVALVPRSLGCWNDNLPPMSEALVDASGAAFAGKFYTIGGKTRAGKHVSSLHIYDMSLGYWSRGPDLPGPAVENPAVASHDGKIYVFGGSTKAFSGAVQNASVFDTKTGKWSVLPEMPTPRAGAIAQKTDGLIYVAGGLGAEGSSLDILEVFNPDSDSWKTDYPPMSTRRDNLGATVLDGKLFVFGGRKRNSDGKTLESRLNSVEVFDPATMNWEKRQSMPTKRRAMIVGSLPCSTNKTGETRLCAQISGGERGQNGETFHQNEEYDPALDSWLKLTPMRSPRHGAAFATYDGALYVAGGGPRAGSSAFDVFSKFDF